MAKHYTDNYLHHLKHEPFVEWDNAKKRYVIDLDGDINPDPKIYRDGKNKPWAESGRRGRKTIMEQFVKARLARLGVCQYRGKSSLSAELKLQQEFKPAPWIQNGEDGTCHVDLGNTDLVPTKNANNKASEDEIRKWEEASLEEKRAIVDDVLKTLKRRREVRECTRKGRKEKRYKQKSTKKKSAAAAAAPTAPVAAAVSSSSTTQSSEPNVTHNHHHHHHHHHHHNTTNINTQGNGKVNINV